MTNFEGVETEDTDIQRLSFSHAFHRKLFAYFTKFAGIQGSAPPPRKKLFEVAASTIISFVLTLLISVIDYWYLNVTFSASAPLVDYNGTYTAVSMLIGAFGATAGERLVAVRIYHNS
jgi:hypothetical protein